MLIIIKKRVVTDNMLKNECLRFREIVNTRCSVLIGQLTDNYENTLSLSFQIRTFHGEVVRLTNIFLNNIKSIPDSGMIKGVHKKKKKQYKLFGKKKLNLA